MPARWGLAERFSAMARRLFGAREPIRAAAPQAPAEAGATAAAPAVAAARSEDRAPEDELRKLTSPVGCVLWAQPELAAQNAKTMFETVEVYQNDNHFSRSLFKCKECGQLYFYEFYERVDWERGNDKMYSTFLPVRDAQEIAALKATNIYTLMRYFPRLQWDAGSPVWRKAE